MQNTTDTRWGRTFAAVVAAGSIAMTAFAGGMVALADQDAPVWQLLNPTVIVPMDHVSDAMAGDLLAQGYRGVPNDGPDGREAEQLYVPRDVAIAACHTDTDCAIASGHPVGSW